jgi:tripartite-type tricarboxylate transporter receptor subunit TctC
MKHISILLRLLLSVMALATAWVGPGMAQNTFPSKPVHIIVPVVGGTMDLLARLVSPKLSEALGQPVIVDTKAGAGGNVGTDFVAKSPPDGSTLLIAFNGPISINVTLFDKLPYDPLKDLAPITHAVSSPQFLVVHPNVPVSTVADLVAYLKARPGRLNYGSVGVGGVSHLTMEMFKTAAGVDLVHVPYKGSAPVMNDVIAGTVQAAFLVPGNVLQHMKSGQMKVIASTGRSRLVSAPSVPTMIEAGFPDFEAISWIGFMTVGGTPRSIIDFYHRELVRILRLPEVHDRLVAIDFEVTGTTPDVFAELIRAEIPKWGAIIRQTGARAN